MDLHAPGFSKTVDGSLNLIEKTTDIPASAVRIDGIAVDDRGYVYVVII